MTTKNLKIHSENILPIIKKWLYSEKEIFVRELVSNACDAIRKVKVLRDQGLTDAKDEEFNISIAIDKEAKTLTFSDTGIGMDAAEVEKYIAQIAFSGAEEFMKKYETHDEKEQFIGHFGLGFYSAYMVADKVEINTLSYKQDAKPVRWICDGSSSYTLEEGTRTTRGTEIILHINPDNEEFLEEGTIRPILERFCAFLPYPLYLNEKHINTHPPLWTKKPSDCTDKDYLEFYRHLYPMAPDPLFWVHLNVDYPFHLQGILYFPKIRRDLELNKKSIKLFCNRVFVSDNCKDILPEYLMPLQGVIESPDIPLNVSRSYLQVDRTVRQVGSHIAKKVADSLVSLSRSQKEKFQKCWEDIAVVVKLGILEDDKFFERVKDILIWKTTEGEWIDLKDYLDTHGEKTKQRVLYTEDAHQLSPLVDLYKEKCIPVIHSTSPIDHYLFSKLEQKMTPVTFQRIDSSLDEELLDKEREKTVLDADGRTEGSKLADFFRSALNQDNVKVEAKSLGKDQVAGFLMIDEQQRRMREYLKQLSHNGPEMPQNSFGDVTFVINTNNPVVSSIQKLSVQKPDLAKELAIQTYTLSQLSQGELSPQELKQFISRSYELLEKVAVE